MNKIINNIKLALAIFVAGTVMLTPVLAASNDRASDKGNKPENHDAAKHDNSAHFDANHRTIVVEYFATQLKSGNCPPGLAKKNNGCLPPGQAKKWELGRALPRDVNRYEIPGALAQLLGQPPSGYQYLGVDDNILLLQLGTELVVDVIESFSR